MNIGDMAAHFRDKSHLNGMITKLGKTEAARRLSWLHDCSETTAEKLIDQFLTDDYVDDKGVKGGRYFWGDL